MIRFALLFLLLIPSMPYSKCPACGLVSHLSVKGDVAAWYSARGKNVGEEVSELCYGCWKELKEYEVVEVIAKPSDTEDVKIGDIGTVLLVMEGADGTKGFEVESVRPDGSNGWLHTFQRHQLRYSPRLNIK
jgi:hypothetical protein